MKKCLVLFLAVVFLCVSGCSSVPVPESSASPETTPEPRGEITISGWDPFNYFSGLAKGFEEKTCIKVNVIRHFDLDSGAYDAYVQQSTSELLTNAQAADIYEVFNDESVNMIDYQGLGEQGYLYDFNEIIGKDEVLNDEKLYTEFFNAVATGEHLYAIPMSVTIMFLGAETEEMAAAFQGQHLTWPEFMEAAAELDLPNRPLVGWEDLGIFLWWFRDRFDEFIDVENRTETLNSPELIEMLQTCDQWREEGLCMAHQDQSPAAMTTSAYRYDPIPRWGPYFWLCDEELHGKTVSSMKYPVHWPSSLSENEYYASSVEQILSINNRSENKELALEFIRYMLSDEVQSSGYLVYTPVNRYAFEQQVDEGFMLYYRGGGERLFEDDSVKERILEKADQATIVQVENKQILAILSEVASEYFNGKITVEEAAKQMSQRVSLYLNEQR